MNLKNTITFLILTILSTQLKAQRYPATYFTSPLDTVLVLEGTFGEIRSNHFHSGIDLSTYQSEGMEVHAAADGYVSRIKISAGGFGKALYITHPNGLVTVYAHLTKFREDIQKMVLTNQYEQKSYEVELFPKEIKITKGEVIALSGGTGDAEGPHLHFEIRDGLTEEPINPLFFGFPIEDTIAPIITKVRIFPVAGQGILNTTDTAATFVAVNWFNELDDTRVKNEYTITSPDFNKVSGLIGFGIETTDHMENSDATLGIYSVQLKVDSNIVYEFKMDRFNFNDSRYVNAHIDYRSMILENQVIQQCFRLPGNHLKIYPDLSKNGYFNFTEDRTHNIEFLVKDFNGNSSTCHFNLISHTLLTEFTYQPQPKGVTISDEKGTAIHKADIDVVISSGAVYDTYRFSESEFSPNVNLIAKVFHVGDRTVPIHTSIAIGIKPLHLPDSLKSKAILVSVDEYGFYESEGGNWKGDFLTANVRHFGDFTITIDTVPPTIVKEYYPADQNTSRGLVVQFKIGDNLSGIKNYSATVDGKWILMEFNKHESLITGDIENIPQNETHQIEVTVTDEKGNVAKLSDTFFY